MKQTLQKLKTLGCLPDHLAMLVQDQKMQAANKINNEGMEAQVKYLLTRFTEEELLDAVRNEFEILFKHHMKFQSKLPEGNVKWKRKK